MRPRGIAREQLCGELSRRGAISPREESVGAHHSRFGAQRASRERAIVAIELGERARCIAASQRGAGVIE